MKKLFLYLIFIIIGAILGSSCSNKEFCWECTTYYSINQSSEVVIKCGFTKSDAEYYEEYHTETYYVYGLPQTKTTTCKKQ